MYNECAFCHEPNIVYCMNRSLQHKHQQQQNRDAIKIDQILMKQHPLQFTKYIEAILASDQQQYMRAFLKEQPYVKEFKYLTQYYKFRIFVPVYSKSKITDNMMSYYYKRLKIYYNSIKRKLNLSIDPSSSQYTSSNSSALKTNLNEQEILKDIRLQQSFKKKKSIKLTNLKDYKTQSKALQQLMIYIKKYNKFDNIQTLKTEDCFNEQQIFQQNQLRRRSYQRILYQPKKIKVDSRFYKKMNEIGSGSTAGIYKIKIISNEYGNRDVNSKSTKTLNINAKGSKDSTLQIQKHNIIESPFRIKESSSIKSIKLTNKDHKKASSLSKLQSFENASPYKRKSVSNEKNKLQIIQTKRSRNNSNENIKIRNNEPQSRIKQTLIKMQTIKFESQLTKIKNKTTPNSPSNRKNSLKISVQTSKNENIISIRKKKLQMLKQRISKK